MDQLQGVAELVVFFSEGQVAAEYDEMEFGRILLGEVAVEELAGAYVESAYVSVSAGLIVNGIVFFMLRFDQAGIAEPDFNLPLQYLLRHAGRGPDLGHGAIRMASRAQCPVPWHSTSMWQPEQEGEDNEAQQVQRVVWRNRLGLKFDKVTQAPAQPVSDLDVTTTPHDVVDQPTPQESEPVPIETRAPEQPPAEIRVPPPTPAVKPSPPPVLRSSNGQKDAAPPPSAPPPISGTQGVTAAQNAVSNVPISHNVVPPVERPASTRALLNTSTTEVSEMVDRLNDRIGELQSRHRDEMHNQQQMYLDQVRECRDEIQRLKSALRHEQARAQRLQQILRGE